MNQITNPQNRQPILIGVGVVTGLFVVNWLFGKDPIPFPNSPRADGPVDQAKIKAMAAEIHARFENFAFNIFSSDRCNTLRFFQNFTNDEMKETAYFYQTEYRKTIRQSIEGVVALDCFSPDPVEHIFTRFRELQIP